jgi:hypothetical protein
LSNLTDKQIRFIDEYLIDLNATQAAIRAGYQSLELPKYGYYTYFLINPIDGHIFYVGKGKDRRMYCHVRNSINCKVDNVHKHKKITEAHSQGFKVIECVFSHHELEKNAYAVERILIDKLKFYGITNAINGSTHENERVEQLVIWDLNRLKTYEQWLRGATRRELNQAITLSGSTLAFYYEIKLNFLRILKASRC